MVLHSTHSSQTWQTSIEFKEVTFALKPDAPHRHVSLSLFRREDRHQPATLYYVKSWIFKLSSFYMVHVIFSRILALSDYGITRYSNELCFLFRILFDMHLLQMMEISLFNQSSIFQIIPDCVQYSTKSLGT